MINPFNSWREIEDFPQMPELARSIFGDGRYRFAGFGDTLKVRPFDRGVAGLPILSKLDKTSGVYRYGGSLYSLPERVVSKSGDVIGFEAHYYNQLRAAAKSKDPTSLVNRLIASHSDVDFGEIMNVGKHSYTAWDAIKAQSHAILETSKSGISSSSGMDYTLAFQRSRMIDISESRISFDIGEMSVSDRLKNLEGVHQQFIRSQGGSAAYQTASLRNYQEIIKAIEGREIDGIGPVYISSVKDQLFRSQAIVSTLSPTDITFHATLKNLGKGIHQFAKLQPISRASIEEFGLDRVTATGAAYGAERRYINNLFQKETGIVGRQLESRFSATTFYALGQVVQNQNELIPSAALADSRSIAGNELYRLTKSVKESSVYQPGIGEFRKRINISGLDDLRNLRVLPQDNSFLSMVIEAAKGHESEAFKRSASGQYILNNPLKLSPHKIEGMKSFLGESVPRTQGEKIASDLKRLLIGSTYDEDVVVRGFRFTGSSLELSMAAPSVVGRGKGIFETPVIIGGRRALQLQVRGLNLESRALYDGSKSTVHQILRAAEGGIGTTLDENIGSAYLSHVAHRVKRKKGQHGLRLLSNALTGLSIKESGQDVIFTADSTAYSSEGGLFQNIAKILKLDSQRLGQMGLSSKDIHAFKLENDRVTLNEAAQEVLDLDYNIDNTLVKKEPNIKRVQEKLVGFRFEGTETSLRGAMDYASKTHGAMSMRMRDMIKILDQQKSHAISAGGSQDLIDAYDTVAKRTRKMILRGKGYRQGAGGVGPPRAIEEIAMIAKAINPNSSGLGLDRVKLKSGSRITLDAWLKGQGPRAIASSVDELRSVISGGGMTAGMLEGTVHAEGFQGMTIDLPKAIKVVVGKDNKAISVKSLPILTDEFLGASFNQTGKFLSSGGVHGLGLPRLKANLMTALQQHGEDFISGNSQIGEDVVTQAGSKYLNALLMSLQGKGGLLNENLQANISGSFYRTITNIESYGYKGPEDLLTMTMNERDFIDLLNAKNLSKEKIHKIRTLARKGQFYLQGYRSPIYQGANLHTFKLRTTTQARDTVGVSGIVADLSYGDFDKDTMAGYIDPDIDTQSALKKIHRHRLRIVDAYAQMMQQQEKTELKTIMKRLEKNELSLATAGSNLSKQELEEKLGQEVLEKISGRAGGAAGGGMFVGPVHTMWAGLSSFGHTVRTEGDRFIQAIAENAPELAEQLSNLSKDSTFAFKTGILQETGIYGFLKKGATGFGGKDMTAIEALKAYAAEPDKYNIKDVKAIFREGFEVAHDAGTFKKSELIDLAQKAGYDIKKMTGSEWAELATDALFGKGTGHNGILTLARGRKLLSQEGITDIYNLMRGDPARLSPENLAERNKQLLETLFGDGTVLTTETAGVIEANAAAENITNATRHAAEAHGSTVSDDLAAQASKSYGEFFSKLKSTFSTKWGKLALAGGAVIGAVGVADMLLGGGGGGQPQISSFDSAGSPLPPQIGVDMPDQDISLPTAASFGRMSSAPARIERPYAQRQLQNVSASIDNNSDMTLLQRGYLGGVGAPPPSQSRIYDNRTDQQDISYMIRSRLKSSF
jgi:hypothetical protein